MRNPPDRLRQDKFLAVTGIMTNTWIFILLADYFVCRKLLRLAPTDNIAFEEGRVRSWNPAGIIAMAFGIGVRWTRHLRLLRDVLRFVHCDVARARRLHTHHDRDTRPLLDADQLAVRPTVKWVAPNAVSWPWLDTAEKRCPAPKSPLSQR